MTFRRVIAAAAVVVLLAGCASRPAPDTGTTAGQPASDSRVLTQEDLLRGQAEGLTNVLAIIRRYRPEWLRPQEPTVWMDRIRMGGINQLSTMTPTLPARVRYLSPAEAQGELGLDNTTGAIVVETR